MGRLPALATLCFAALALSGCGDSPVGVPPTGAPNGGGVGGGTVGDLIWSDEFDGPGGTPPDSTRWTHDIGTDWGNSQLEYDTARPINVSHDGQGHLAITAHREEYNGSSFTSGRITTRGRYGQTRGRFEARIRMPVGRGLWPAFWLLGSDVASVGWPACGEIDIMEYRGQQPAVVHGSLHGPGYSGGQALTRAFTLPSGGFNDGFHVFAVQWETNQISYEVDGVRYQTLKPADLPRGARWVFDHPFNIMLNLAVGGTFVGNPDASTSFPQTLLVDYVRVYKVEP
ncbi:MAG TPA: glycoside hydrolase family 16 protein [Candidatus Eisenbacteria bacterium]|nr:glycoside hydrolase family 16 protein [Candidatus Eisenbacteria bacterium]